MAVGQSFFVCLGLKPEVTRPTGHFRLCFSGVLNGGGPKLFRLPWGENGSDPSDGSLPVVFLRGPKWWWAKAFLGFKLISSINYNIRIN